MTVDERALAAAEAQTRASRPPTKTLKQSVAVFFAQASPRLITVFVATSIAFRLFGEKLDWRELIAVPAVMFVWPLMEWGAHRWLLHIRPQKVGNLTIDPYFAWRHRQHHLNPSDIPLIFLPTRVIAGAYVAFGTVFWFVLGRDAGATALACVSTGALIYEWTHFIAHVDFVPKSTWARLIVTNHRMHHYRNERHWYAFTVPWLDAWLGTGGTAAEVAASRDTRTLGIEPGATPRA
jgi:hypothetical protein